MRCTGRPRPTRADGSMRGSTRSTAGTCWTGRGSRCAATAARPASPRPRWRTSSGMGSPAARGAGAGPQGAAVSATAGAAGVHPKPGSSQQRPLSIPTVRDRIVQAALKIVLEPIFEADMLDCSFGFRPRRSAHDALQVLIDESWQGRRYVVETDVANCFEAIPHSGLLQAVEERVSDRAVLALLRVLLRAGVMQDGSRQRSEAGTPQGGVKTPPTQQITRGRVGACDRDAVADDHTVGTNQHLLDQQAQHPLPLGDRGGIRLVAQPRQEAVEGLGELEVGRLVDQLGVEGVKLGAHGLLLGAQGGHAASQLLQRQQLLLVGLQQPADGGGGAGLLALQPRPGRGDRVGGVQLVQAPVELGAYQAGVGQQPGHVLPDDLRSEEHMSELQSRPHLVCRLLLEKKKKKQSKKYAKKKKKMKKKHNPQ